MKGACQPALTSSFGKGRRGQSSLLENPPVSLWRSFLWRYSFLQRGIQISGPERDGRGVEPGCRLKVAWGCLHLTELCVSRSPLCPWPSYLESQWFAIIESKPPFWGGGRQSRPAAVSRWGWGCPPPSPTPVCTLRGHFACCLRSSLCCCLILKSLQLCRHTLCVIYKLVDIACQLGSPLPYYSPFSIHTCSNFRHSFSHGVLWERKKFVCSIQPKVPNSFLPLIFKNTLLPLCSPWLRWA